MVSTTGNHDASYSLIRVNSRIFNNITSNYKLFHEKIIRLLSFPKNSQSLRF